MSQRFNLVFILIFSILSCQDDTAKRAADNARELKKQELVFKNLNEAWSFNTQARSAADREVLAVWDQWRIFVNELEQKPKSSVTAFRQKAKTLSTRVLQLQETVPPAYNRPEVRSRVTALITKVNALNLYMNLNDIPEKKVLQNIKEVNDELASLSRQLEETKIKDAIPLEQGEADMLKLLDTSRAIPN
ncbi:hypothetical protein [Flavobacterium ardleyense]|uniref:hypothetical protein n=1 Tax=Flavobacterium ardleyense TaxID=2038737 RepID=UPI00298D1833|nr:hypothetical protein [Flavobacterium ardleyense]